MNDPNDVFTRHRGPYTLQGSRATKRPGFFKSVIVARGVETADVCELAQAFLSDPRDTLVGGMAIWSERENQFVTTIHLGANND